MTVSFNGDPLCFPCSSVPVQTIRFNAGAALMTLRHIAPGADHSTSDTTGMWKEALFDHPLFFHTPSRAYPGVILSKLSMNIPDFSPSAVNWK